VCSTFALDGSAILADIVNKRRTFIPRQYASHNHGSADPGGFFFDEGERECHEARRNWSSLASR
jgi:hypothetical protein